MTAFIQPFINLLLFRAGPQDMPASQQVLKFVLMASIVTGALGSIGTLGLPAATLISVSQIALYGVFVYLMLKMFRKPERWLQTIIAIYGATALMNLACLPFLQNLSLFSEGQLVITEKLLIVGVLQLWLLIVTARILKEAAEISMGRAVLLTLLMVYVIQIFLAVFLGVLGFEPNTMGTNSVTTEAQ